MNTKRTAVPTALCLYIARYFVHVRCGMRKKGGQRICFCKWEVDQEQVLLSGAVRPTAGHGSNSRLPSGPAESVCSCSSEGRNLTPTQTLLSPHTVTLSSLLPTLFTCLRTYLFFKSLFKDALSFILMLGNPRGVRPPIWGSRDHTQDTPRSVELWKKWSTRRTELYVTTRNTHNGQRSMTPVGFEPAIPESGATADSCLRPLAHWDRQRRSLGSINEERDDHREFV